MIDLHLHLDGSLSPRLVMELAKEQALAFPAKTEEQARALLSAPESCQSLNEYLSRFDWPMKVLQSADALTRAAADLAARLKEQGLLYVEVRFAPQLHTQRGLSQAQAVEAVLAGLRTVELPSQLILCCMRGKEEEANLETLRVCARFLGDGVCAADLAGAEALYPTSLYQGLFQRATELHVPFTLHSGEADGPQSVWAALSFGAARIGHGVRCTQDSGLIRELAARQIPLELCYTSNLQTKAVSGPAAFPLRKLLQAGVRATINTDNMTVSGTTLRQEWKKLSPTPEEEAALLKNSVDAAFLPPEKKRALRERVLQGLAKEA